MGKRVMGHSDSEDSSDGEDEKSILLDNGSQVLSDKDSDGSSASVIGGAQHDRKSFDRASGDSGSEEKDCAGHQSTDVPMAESTCVEPEIIKERPDEDAAVATSGEAGQAEKEEDLSGEESKNAPAVASQLSKPLCLVNDEAVKEAADSAPNQVVAVPAETNSADEKGSESEKPLTSKQESQPAEQESQPQQVCNFFRKPSKAKNIRKRTIDADDDDEDSKSGSSLLHNLKKAQKPDNKLYFSSGPSKSSTTSNEPPVKPVFLYESSKEIQVQNDSRATATLDTETEFTRDSRAIREKALKRAEEALKGNKKNPDEKLYTGINGYTDHRAGFRREQTISSEKAGGSHGPLRASAHIRTSVRFDYQPDICKDYKETGYCGYGDSCKFMHDRGDYKPGWQIEKEWEEAEKARKRNQAMGIEDDDEEEDKSDDDEDDALPFACFICRQPFADPVVTKCKHYFCEHCALRHHAKNKKCFVCNQPTLGIFNTAHDIKKKIAEERTKAL